MKKPCERELGDPPMSNEPASASPFQEFLEERLKQLKDWGLFFKQRRAIVDRPEVLLGAKASIGWLSPVRYFLHGLAIIAVASNVLMFGVDQWISSLYNAKLVALYEL